MSITHSFYSELPSGQSILVEVEIEPLVPAYTSGLPEDCYPEEGGTAEIQTVQIVTKDADGKTVLIDIDTSDIWVRGRADKFKYFDDELADAAYNNWENEL